MNDSIGVTKEKRFPNANDILESYFRLTSRHFPQKWVLYVIPDSWELQRYERCQTEFCRTIWICPALGYAQRLHWTVRQLSASESCL
jgi:hypothetical protein